MQKENGDLNSLQTVAYGDNRWWKSVYRQWLNSDQPATKWWTPQDKWDMMPECAKTIPGFLAGFSEGFKGALTGGKVVSDGSTVRGGGSAVGGAVSTAFGMGSVCFAGARSGAAAGAIACVCLILAMRRSRPGE